MEKEKSDKNDLSKSVGLPNFSNDENSSDSISPKIKRFNDQIQNKEQNEPVEDLGNEVFQSEEIIQEDYYQHGSLFLLSSRKLPQIQHGQETNAVIEQNNDTNTNIEQKSLGTSSNELSIIMSQSQKYSQGDETTIVEQKILFSRENLWHVVNFFVVLLILSNLTAIPASEFFIKPRIEYLNGGGCGGPQGTNCASLNELLVVLNVNFPTISFEHSTNGILQGLLAILTYAIVVNMQISRSVKKIVIRFLYGILAYQVFMRFFNAYKIFKSLQ